jgi:Domain of unknown function (DUF6881)
MTSYLRVKWKHSFSTEPVLLYSELDGERWETRKVEVFTDGRRDFASASETSGNTRLSKEPLPALEEIASDPQFEPVEITRTEFEEVWA